MVATVLSDALDIFLRKIGYSVGLEFTAERVSDLVSLYLENRDITPGAWNQLVTLPKCDGGWARNKSAAKHISDFFFSLRLIQSSAGDLVALENLDAMAIARMMIHPSKWRQAEDFLLLWALAVNDGDIFINLLLADFDRERISGKLEAMIIQKRAKAEEIFAGRVPRERINRSIAIERQERNVGSAGLGQSVRALERTEPLGRTDLQASKSAFQSFGLSDDYFKKVPPRRLDWARSLGLWDQDQALSAQGRSFIRALRDKSYIDEGNVFSFWPMEFELVRAGQKPDLFGSDTKTLWQCLTDFGEAYAGISIDDFNSAQTEHVIQSIRMYYEHYQSLHVRKSKLRMEIPITVVYPVAVAIACANKTPLINFPDAILEEQSSNKGRLAVRRSRLTGSAFRVKKQS